MEEVRKRMNVSKELCDIVQSMKLFADAPKLAQAHVITRLIPTIFKVGLLLRSESN
jgi:hypothetical protein